MDPEKDQTKSEEVLEECDKWFVWYLQMICEGLPQSVVAAIGLPHHITEERIRELTARRLDRLPEALKQAADIVEQLDQEQE